MIKTIPFFLLTAGCVGVTPDDLVDDTDVMPLDIGLEETPLDIGLDGCGEDDCAEACANAGDLCERQRCAAECRSEIVGQCDCLLECAETEYACVQVRDCGIVGACVDAAEQCREAC